MGRPTQSGRYWLSCSISDGRFVTLPGTREPPENRGDRLLVAPLPRSPAFFSGVRACGRRGRTILDERGGEAPWRAGCIPSWIYGSPSARGVAGSAAAVAWGS